MCYNIQLISALLILTMQTIKSAMQVASGAVAVQRPHDYVDQFQPVSKRQPDFMVSRFIFVGASCNVSAVVVDVCKSVPKDPTPIEPSDNYPMDLKDALSPILQLSKESQDKSVKRIDFVFKTWTFIQEVILKQKLDETNLALFGPGDTASLFVNLKKDHGDKWYMTSSQLIYNVGWRSIEGDSSIINAKNMRDGNIGEIKDDRIKSIFLKFAQNQLAHLESRQVQVASAQLSDDQAEMAELREKHREGPKEEIEALTRKLRNQIEQKQKADELRKRRITADDVGFTKETGKVANINYSEVKCGRVKGGNERYQDDLIRTVQDEGIFKVTDVVDKEAVMLVSIKDINFRLLTSKTEKFRIVIPKDTSIFCKVGRTR